MIARNPISDAASCQSESDLSANTSRTCTTRRSLAASPLGPRPRRTRICPRKGRNRSGQLYAAARRMTSSPRSTRYTDANDAPTNGLTRSSANWKTSSARSAVRKACTISRTATSSRMAVSSVSTGMRTRVAFTGWNLPAARRWRLVAAAVRRDTVHQRRQLRHERRTGHHLHAGRARGTDDLDIRVSGEADHRHGGRGRCRSESCQHRCGIEPLHFEVHQHYRRGGVPEMPIELLDTLGDSQRDARATGGVVDLRPEEQVGNHDEYGLGLIGTHRILYNGKDDRFQNTEFRIQN